MSESEFEPVPGLPERLPQGERMLWQGAPNWLSLALTAFRARAVAIYFAVLMVWRAASALYNGGTPRQAIEDALWLAPLALVALAILLTVAFLSAKTTVYTITDRRIVMRFGMALPLTINIPFTSIDAAATRRHADGTGDIPLTPRADERIGYLMLWPHARPLHFARPEPMLRSLPDVDRAATILADALAAHAGIAPRPVLEAQAAGATMDRPHSATLAARGG